MYFIKLLFIHSMNIRNQIDQISTIVINAVVLKNVYQDKCHISELA